MGTVATGPGGEPGGAVRTEIELLLSGRCNLACSYCFQDNRRVRAAMSWETVQLALDAALLMGSDGLSVEFNGGEPLLEPELLRRAVGHLERHRGRRDVSLLLTTNGTLLTRELLDLLVAHSLRLRLSFDGVPAAQDLRAPGTFAVLDRLLDLLRLSYPTYFGENVCVGMTLCAAAIPHLAQSVRYFIGKGVAEIDLEPRLAHDPEWKEVRRDELRAQVDEVLEISLIHWRRTGEVPLKLLSGAPLRNPDAPVGDFLCRAAEGRAFVVDPDGRAWACPLLAPSLRAIPPLAAEASRVMALGAVSDRALAGRLQRLPDRARALRMFTDKRAKYSIYGACAKCRFAPDCQVCPVSICHIPNNDDPDQVPGFLCAYNQVALAARERFDGMTGGALSAAWYGEVRGTLARLESALKNAVVRRGEERARGSGRSRRPATNRRT